MKSRGALRAVGIGSAGEAVINFLTERFTDHSQKLTAALQKANDRAWKAMEIALAGESLWDRCKVAFACGDDQAFRQQVRAFLDASPLTKASAEHAPLFQLALQELRAVRSQGVLTGGGLVPDELARRVGDFACFADPQALIEAEWQMVEQSVGELRASCPNLWRVLVARTRSGQRPSILVVAVRYYFRREVETDQELFRGLAFAKLEALHDAWEKGFTALTEALTQQGDRWKWLLDETFKPVIEKRGVLSDQLQKVLEHLQLRNREVRPSDSLSIRSEAEQQRVRQVVGEYRVLPEELRRQRPDLLNEVGKLEVAAGEMEDAQKDFEAAAAGLSDPRARAEAHHNAYRAALERQQWGDALDALRQAVALDPGRFAPFPMEQYEPVRILGAGGFGVVFLCRHCYLGTPLVVKSLLTSELDRDIIDVFSEARALEDLDHPAIIRLRDCAFADADRTRPYLVMDYFDGKNLADHVASEGHVSPEDLREIARLVAAALQAAHTKSILHRDVKTGNVLVRRDGGGWRVKLIDFGLALRPAMLEGKISTQQPQARTTIGRSVAGTLHYAAPEQMGQLPGVAVGAYSDVYGFGRTCYFALLGTPDPDDVEKENLPDGWRQLLSGCTGRKLKHRLPDFDAVAAGLAQVSVVDPDPRVVRIFDFSPTSVLHWLGKGGWIFEDARKAMNALGASHLKDSTIKTGLADGRNPKYSKPAPLTQDQAEKLHDAAGHHPPSKVSSRAETKRDSDRPNKFVGDDEEGDAILKAMKSGMVSSKESSRAETKRDRFGNRLGTNRAEANKVLTTEPKTMKQILEEAEITDTVYTPMKELIARGIVVKVGKGFKLAFSFVADEAKPAAKDRFGSRLGTVRAKFNACLGSKPKTAQEVAQETGYPVGRVGNYLRNLARRKPDLVAETDEGYRLAEAMSADPDGEEQEQGTAHRADPDPSNKEIVYRAWLADGKDANRAEEYLRLVDGRVMLTTINGWIAEWKRGHNLPACAKKDRFGNRVGTQAATINAALSTTPKTAEEIMDETACKNTPNHLRWLVDRGVVVKTEDGKYMVKAESQEPVARDCFGSCIGSSNAAVNAVLTTTPKTYNQIVEETGLRPKQVRYSHLNGLVERGLVVKTEEGYRLARDTESAGKDRMAQEQADRLPEATGCQQPTSKMHTIESGCEPQNAEELAQVHETVPEEAVALFPPSLIGGNEDAEARLIERLRHAPDRQWAERFLDLARELVEVAGLGKDDPRLVMSIPQEKCLPITINSRYVLTAFRIHECPPGHAVLDLILPASMKDCTEKLPGVIQRGPFNPAFVGETVDNVPHRVSFCVTAKLDFELDVLKGWKQALLTECDHGSRSRFRKSHEPVVYRAATDLQYRQRVLDLSFPA